MGGAGGHMIHPYQCPEVKNGEDLIAFYIRAVQSIEDNPPSIKLDGVNVSFRLKQISSYPGFEFVVDRGTKTNPYDFEGISGENAHLRFVSGDPNTPHNMIKATETLTSILNSDRENLKPYLEELGVFDRMGPYGIFFNTEFYSDKDGDGIGNVTKYNKNFIAIHGLGEFYKDEKGSRSRQSVYQEIENQINDLKKNIDDAAERGEDTREMQQQLISYVEQYHNKKDNNKKILDNIAKELEDNANKVDFRSFSTIPVKFQPDESVETVIAKINEELDKEWTFLHKNFYLQNKNNEQFDGPMGVGPGKVNTETGEFSGRSLREHLENIKTNPEHNNPDVRVSDYYFREILKKERNPNDRERVRYVFSQDIYEAVAENDIGVADIAYQNEDVAPINDAVVIWHAIRVIGNVIKQSLMSDVDLGLPVYEQEGVVLQSPDTCNGYSFKLTGEFFLQNRAGGQGEKKHKVGQMLHEVKMYEEDEDHYHLGPMGVKTSRNIPLEEQEDNEEENRQYVILIPGGFKPPTGGHYSMIKQYDKKPDVLKVFVITGGVERDGITLQQSKQIFNVYGGFSDKVEFIETEESTPLTACYKLMENSDFVNQFPNAHFSIGAGNKGKDPQRIKDFINYFIKNEGLTDAKIRYYQPADTHMVRGEPASASRMRKALAAEDWELFKELLPHPDLYDDVVQILGGQAEEPVNENFLLAIPRSFLVEKMTRKQKNKKEKIVKGMKKNTADLKKRYGKDWESVMYATATKQAVTEELGSEQEQQLRNRISAMLANIMARIPELNQSTTSEKAEIGEPLLDTVLSHLTQSIVQKTKNVDTESEVEQIKDKMVAEMSSMAGGAVAGHANNAWNTGGDDDEQKRKSDSRT